MHLPIKCNISFWTIFILILFMFGYCFQSIAFTTYYHCSRLNRNCRGKLCTIQSWYGDNKLSATVSYIYVMRSIFHFMCCRWIQSDRMHNNVKFTLLQIRLETNQQPKFGLTYQIVIVW